MCGVFGFVGADRPANEVVTGLRELEYRGYDSWGVAVSAVGMVKVEKGIGPVPKNLRLSGRSRLALGHTRWATHGGVTLGNAHPHSDEQNRYFVVHNGIVENAVSLRSALQLAGHKFVSQTDTETIVHLYESQRDQLKPQESFARMWSQLEGLNAVVMLDQLDGSLLFGKRGSPLAIGRSSNGWYIASDGLAFGAQVDVVCFLEDGWYGRLAGDGLELFSEVGRVVKPVWEKLAMVSHTPSIVKKFPHLMLQEMHQQPVVIDRIAELPKADLQKFVHMYKISEEVILLGCGTAYHAALVAQQWLAVLAGKSAEVYLASEANARLKLVGPQTLVIALSQSGETINLIEPCNQAKQLGAKVVALVNAPHSTLDRLADETLLLNAGREKAVASTKAFMAKLAVLYRLSAQMGGLGSVKPIKAGARAVSKTLLHWKVVEKEGLINCLKTSTSLFVLGKGIYATLAREAALKIKEISYIHAEGMSSSELKHGSLALIEPGVPCIFLIPDDEAGQRDTLSAVAEVKARGGLVVGLSDKAESNFDFHLPVVGKDLAYFFSMTATVQLLAYELALSRGLDPDKPRNLAKSVTVK